jgi:hypothetical protein
MSQEIENITFENLETWASLKIESFFRTTPMKHRSFYDKYIHRQPYPSLPRCNEPLDEVFEGDNHFTLMDLSICPSSPEESCRRAPSISFLRGIKAERFLAGRPVLKRIHNTWDRTFLVYLKNQGRYRQGSKFSFFGQLPAYVFQKIIYNLDAQTILTLITLCPSTFNHFAKKDFLKRTITHIRIQLGIHKELMSLIIPMHDSLYQLVESLSEVEICNDAGTEINFNFRAYRGSVKHYASGQSSYSLVCHFDTCDSNLGMCQIFSSEGTLLSTHVSTPYYLSRVKKDQACLYVRQNGRLKYALCMNDTHATGTVYSIGARPICFSVSSVSGVIETGIERLPIRKIPYGTPLAQGHQDRNGFSLNFNGYSLYSKWPGSKRTSTVVLGSSSYVWLDVVDYQCLAEFKDVVLGRLTIHREDTCFTVTTPFITIFISDEVTIDVQLGAAPILSESFLSFFDYKKW